MPSRQYYHPERKSKSVSLHDKLDRAIHGIVGERHRGLFDGSGVVAEPQGHCDFSLATGRDAPVEPGFGAASVGRDPFYLQDPAARIPDDKRVDDLLSIGFLSEFENRGIDRSRRISLRRCRRDGFFRNRPCRLAPGGGFFRDRTCRLAPGGGFLQCRASRLLAGGSAARRKLQNQEQQTKLPQSSHTLSYLLYSVHWKTSHQTILFVNSAEMSI